MNLRFHNIKDTEMLSRTVKRQARKLSRHGHVRQCNVLVESQSPTHPKYYRVWLSVKVPGHDIIIDQTNESAERPANPFTAVREAFSAADHKLRKLHKGHHETAVLHV